MRVASELIFNFVLNAGWQIVVIFAVAALASWLLKNGPARYRHALWVVALIACLVVPLLTATRFVPTWVSSVQVVAPPTNPVQVTVGITRSEDFDIDHLVTKRTKPVNTTARTAVYLMLAYVLVVFLRGITLARFWRRKEKLRRSATRAGLTPEIEHIAQRCRSIFGVDAAVARSDKARVPYTIGARRPLILLPTAFCSGADEPRLLSVIGHEMAHVARRDFLTNLVCELIALPIAFHPLTFVIKKQIDRTRELACDELVTGHVLAPRIYARSLLWAADVSRQYPSQTFMLSIFDGKILEERIMRLTRNKSRLGPGLARVLMVAALSLVCVAAMSVSMFALELQTQARVFVQPLQVLTQPAPASSPVYEPIARPVSIIDSRQEPKLNAPTPDERAISACNAGKRGDAAAIPSLIAMLADDTEAIDLQCWSTGRWSPALHVFKHPSPGEQAAIALASFGRRALMPLTTQLDSPNATVRRNAAWAIGELTAMLPGERAGTVPQLIIMLNDSDEWVRMAAARALGELADRRSVEGLIARLGDDQWRVRQMATWALSEMKDARAVPALSSVLLSDARAEVRRGAAEALGEIANAEALPSLKQALNDAETSVSTKAAWAIAEIEG
jgi:HEAT repeat protein/beta-lactamase regulating signal transducer with metallopeptidase domain